jgi:hypothetical protein
VSNPGEYDVVVLGSRVTVVDRNDALAHREDRDVSEALRGLFDDDRTSVNDNLPPNGYRTTLIHDRMEALCLLLPACPPGGHGDHRTADPGQRDSSLIRLTAWAVEVRYRIPCPELSSGKRAIEPI